ncbi:hypothetical protein BpHYR1_033083 [Brachionus plicatilis]|uniref:Uncharacterized protein n=1 Tax=Brachionus plicatilis TaxID=10195 RepID=A0A3M7RIK7_BRAPC|nr:hypothetical protein BpHYR1_033083 [Brachionus plicatilis]
MYLFRFKKFLLQKQLKSEVNLANFVVKFPKLGSSILDLHGYLHCFIICTDLQVKLFLIATANKMRILKFCKKIHWCLVISAEIIFWFKHTLLKFQVELVKSQTLKSESWLDFYFNDLDLNWVTKKTSWNGNPSVRVTMGSYCFPSSQF